MLEYNYLERDDVMKDIDVRQKGTAALLQALGPLGMARYLEQYDNGGQGY